MDEEEALVGPDGEDYVHMVVRSSSLCEWLESADARIVASQQSSAYCFGKFDSGGFSKSLPRSQPAKGASRPPNSRPDGVYTDNTSPEQAVLYRLSGKGF